MFLLIKKMVMTIVAAVSIAASACEAVPPPPPYVAPAQAPNTVHLQGDSVTFNTYFETGLVPDYATTSEFVPGASIDFYGWGMADKPAAMDTVPKLIEEGKVDRLVWALGLNEIYQKGGWTEYHRLLWTDLLYQKLPKESCLVIVKPWVTEAAYPLTSIDAIISLRDWINNLAAKRPNTVIVDWKPIFEAHPEYSLDGMHVEKGTGGPEARDAMYRSGLTRCS